MEAMVKVKFTEAYTVKDAEARTYEKGEVCEMPMASAQHFVNRRVAVIVTRAAKRAPETASVAAPETAVMPTGKPRK
jgi:hypothetical protein